MPIYIESTSSMAASAALENAISDKRYRTSPRPRVLKAIAAYTQDNTPAEDDVTVEVIVDEVTVCKFPAGLARTTGAPLQAEDYVPVNYAVPQNATMTVKVTNNDAAAAHRAKLALSIDGF